MKEATRSTLVFSVLAHCDGHLLLALRPIHLALKSVRVVGSRGEQLYTKSRTGVGFYKGDTAQERHTRAASQFTALPTNKYSPPPLGRAVGGLTDTRRVSAEWIRSLSIQLSNHNCMLLP